MASSRPAPSARPVEGDAPDAEPEPHAEPVEQGSAWLPALLGVIVTLVAVALVLGATLLAIRLFG